MDSIELERQFGIAGVLRFEDMPGGLVRAVMSAPDAEADLYLQGAHVTHWTPKGRRPVLFVSSKSLFAPGKAIRGGVPVIFPWFGGREGGKPGPAHGFARSMPWQVTGSGRAANGDVELALELTANDATRALGYDAFRALFRVTVGASLKMELEVRNEGTGALRYEQALHSYFEVADIHQTAVTGLEGTTFIDKTDGFARRQQPGEPVRAAKETDQVHLDTRATCVVEDAVWGRRIVVEKSGSESTVVWNPWIAKTAGMSDMAPDEWQRMICVETANAADNAITLGPGERHVLVTSVRVE